jgi:hypothetical protein
LVFPGISFSIASRHSEGYGKLIGIRIWFMDWVGLRTTTLPTARAGKHWARAQLAATHTHTHTPFIWTYVNWTLKHFLFPFLLERGGEAQRRDGRRMGYVCTLHTPTATAGIHFVPYDLFPFASKHYNSSLRLSSVFLLFNIVILVTSKPFCLSVLRLVRRSRNTPTSHAAHACLLLDSCTALFRTYHIYT